MYQINVNYYNSSNHKAVAKLWRRPPKAMSVAHEYPLATPLRLLGGGWFIANSIG